MPGRCGHRSNRMTMLARAFALALAVVSVGGCAGLAPEPQPSDPQSAGPSPAPAQAARACSAPKSTPKGICAGCSVSCDDRLASCTAGEEWAGDGGSCMKTAVCECR